MSPAQACQWCGFALSELPNIMRPFMKGDHADDEFMPRHKSDSPQCKACGNYAIAMLVDAQLRKTELAAVKKNEQLRESWRVKVFGAQNLDEIIALFEDDSFQSNCYIGSYRANNGFAQKTDLGQYMELVVSNRHKANLRIDAEKKRSANVVARGKAKAKSEARRQAKRFRKQMGTQ